MSLTINRMKDVTNLQYPTLLEYETKMKRGHFSEAQQLIANGYDQNIMGATNFNLLASAISTLEPTVIENVNKGDTGVDALYLYSIVQELKNMPGPWRSVLSYKFGNTVVDEYTNNSYFAIRDCPRDIQITDTNYWVQIYEGKNLDAFRPVRGSSEPWYHYDPRSTGYSLNDFACDKEQSAIYIWQTRFSLFWKKILERMPAAQLKIGATLPSSPMQNTFFGVQVNYV